MKAFRETQEQTLDRLGIDRQIGLNEAQVEESAKKYGINSFTKGASRSLFSRIVDASREPMLIMLMIAAIIALGVNIANYINYGHAEFIECVGIFVAILLAIAITVVMEGRSEKAFETLNKIKDDIEIKGIRNGKVSLISGKDLVVGDIVIIETGDKIPADGRLLEATSLNVDESSLTGESVAVKKDANAICDNDKTPVAERKNMIYSGCFVTGGNGAMVVTEVGDSTEFGNIAKELSTTDKGSTPLQEKLARLGKTITIFGTSAATIVFILQIIAFYANKILTLQNVSEAFITSIVLIVASVPEGLPTIVAVSLAINIIKMSKQNALVRKMIACETIGCINIICSDKTGTLTENRMTVVDIYTNGAICKPSDLKQGYLTQNFCINSTANVEHTDNVPKFIGNPTECALIVAYGKSNPKDNYKTLRDEANDIYEYPFSSETKNMTTVILNDNEFVAFSKGSPEKILALCSMVMIDGKSTELTPEIVSDIEEKIMSHQKKAGRVLAFAHKEFAHEPDFEHERNVVESEMVYDGFIVITDPLREEVYDAVLRCKNAGIGLKMLTGDNIVTARAIAEELGILEEGTLAVEANELNDLPDDEFIKILPSVRVIARSTPVIKMKVVNALKSLGNVVAVTGDGINDAPAIKNADVGIAMGISGTEVSKEASDIVLLDDSFATIVKAVQWGRGIYENFQRFIQFQLTVNLSSVVVVIASILAGFGSPFTALQLLWVNIIMDGPPALTLGLEPIRGDLMHRKPTPRNTNIVSKDMFSKIAFNGIYISIVFLLQLSTKFIGGSGSSEEEQSAILFTLFVMFQMFNAFNARELSESSAFANILKNKMMLLVFGLTFLLQVIITQFGGAVFHTVPLPLMIWVKILGTAFSVIIASEVYKLLIRLVKGNSR